MLLTIGFVLFVSILTVMYYLLERKYLKILGKEETQLIRNSVNLFEYMKEKTHSPKNSHEIDIGHSPESPERVSLSEAAPGNE